MGELEKCQEFVGVFRVVDFSVPPPDGYRYVFVDEIIQFQKFRKAVNNFLRNDSDGEKVALINGFTDGKRVYETCELSTDEGYQFQ